MDQQHKERMRINAVVKELELEMAEQDYQNEKRNAAKEFEEKKVETEMCHLASQTNVLHVCLKFTCTCLGGNCHESLSKTNPFLLFKYITLKLKQKK